MALNARILQNTENGDIPFACSIDCLVVGLLVIEFVLLPFVAVFLATQRLWASVDVLYIPACKTEISK